MSVRRDPHDSWPIERAAVSVQGWSVNRVITCAARPGGVPAAVAEAGLMADEHFTGAEVVPVGTACRWVNDPLPGCRRHEIAQHSGKPMPEGQSPSS